MKAKYDIIGIDYNLTRRADKYLVQRLLYHLNPKKNGRYLDIGCGTGNYTIGLQKKGFDFMGIDPSIEMLEKAKKKNQQIDWRVGTAEKTGLKSKSVDGVVGSLTIHHWADLEKGFGELQRILKPNGKIVIFTSTPEQMKGYWLNRYFPKMLEDSILQMPSLEKVSLAMKKSGIEVEATETYAVKPDLQDLFLYCGKDRPELYFRDDVRNGISSFSSLSNQQEVKQGLSDLRSDIDSGKIKGIMDSYKNDFGDYLYIIGRKASS